MIDTIYVNNAYMSSYVYKNQKKGGVNKYLSIWVYIIYSQINKTKLLKIKDSGSLLEAVCGEGDAIK